MSTYSTTNPTSGQALGEFPVLESLELEALLERAASMYRQWRLAALSDRCAALERVAATYRERASELGSVVTGEIGKPITQALGEIELAASIYEYYARNAKRFLSCEGLAIAGTGSAYVRRDPIGVILGIMPWNYPHYQVARFAAPNIALGNTVIVKHAPNCGASASLIEQIGIDSGLTDVYCNAFLTTEQVASVIADPRVQGVSLTGSERAGTAVAEHAGRHLKRVVLELGGSDAFIVRADADIDAAARAGALGRLANAGQACTASKRFIVHVAVYDAFTAALGREMAAFRVGDPMDPATTLGPLVSETAAISVATLVEEALAAGAVVLYGEPHRSGAFLNPLLLGGVSERTPAFDTEIFGPVGVVHPVASDEEAIAVANATTYGLGATVFTADIERAHELAALLDVGMVWINSTSRSAPDLPFGGVKRSGFGRELARLGIDEFANIKLVRQP